MPRRSPFVIELTKEERAELEARVKEYTSPYRDVMRAKIVLLASEGLGNDSIAARLSMPRQIVSNAFGNLFRGWCRQAGLPHCSAHGLRKAAASRLAEHGATIHEIAAVTGHRSLKEVQRYTKGVEQKRLAASAMARLSSVQTAHKKSHSGEGNA
jgi:integrase